MRGDVERAELIRIEQQIARLGPDDAGHPRRVERLRELAAMTDPRWRALAARPPIENCDPVFSLECPREWGALTTTDQPHVRRCDSCSQSIYYCATLDEARGRAQLGQCVAVDTANERRPNDLTNRHTLRVGMIAAPRFDDD